MTKKFVEGYIKLENFITNFLLVSIVFFVFIAAVLRWVGYPLAWSVEFAQLLFVWAIFLGANRTLREDKHIGVDFFVRKMPVRLRLTVEIMMYVLVIAFLVFLSYFGLMLSIENSVRLINNLPFSYSMITMAVPVGSMLMIITAVKKIIGKIGLMKNVSDNPFSAESNLREVK